MTSVICILIDMESVTTACSRGEIFSAKNLKNPTLEKDPSNGESGLHCFKKKGRYMGEFVLSTNHDLFLRDKQRRPMWEPRKGSRARPNESEGNE